MSILASEGLLRWAIAELENDTDLAAAVAGVGGRIAESEGDDLPTTPGVFVFVLSERHTEQWSESCELGVYVLWPTPRSTGAAVFASVKALLHREPAQGAAAYGVAPSTKGIAIKKCRYLDAIPFGQVEPVQRGQRAGLLRFEVRASPSS